ncbi:WD repeat-containing protein JIP5 [Grifola frondosa]|uniref:WD repeat-containing protein JIP5 n=1 Tax=Grifola frondosa TaxID=5627 RepID=A0A1C7MH15_GRIFR|nr:WD repeat-containing protein JIP5 [Grifola frondosa]
MELSFGLLEKQNHYIRSTFPLGRSWMFVRMPTISAPINRMKRLLPHLLTTGDDDGVIKLWDPKQLVATSGDGTLSVIDVRSKSKAPLAQSEDQEDELLSIVPIKGGQKIVVGTQIGMLSVFNRRNGWGDCVDRIPGHPQSIDALCALPSHYPNSQSTILTGSSDGLLRAVQLLPTKLLGVVADHGEFPIERIAVDMGGQGRWVGSAGHEEILKLTDLKEVFEDEDEDENEEGNDSDEEGDGEEAVGTSGNGEEPEKEEPGAQEEVDAEEKEGSSEEEEVIAEPRKRRRKEKDPLHTASKKKGRNEVDAEPAFLC